MPQKIDVVIVQKVPCLSLFKTVYWVMKAEDVPSEKQKAEKQDVASFSETATNAMVDDNGQIYLNINLVQELMGVDVRVKDGLV